MHQEKMIFTRFRRNAIICIYSPIASETLKCFEEAIFE